MPTANGLSKNDSLRPHPRTALVLCLLLAFAAAAHAQTPQPDTPQQPATTPAPAPAPAPATTPVSPSTPDAAQPAEPTAPAATTQTPATSPPATPIPAASPADQEPARPSAQSPSQPGAITEDELKHQLVGKQLYLRGGYLGDSLNFDEHGRIVGHSPQGSYTLSVLQLDHVRLTKHKVEFDGIRFGLHFNEQLAYEDSEKAYDKVRVTPNKKTVKITIDREIVVNPKKKKESAKDKAKQAKPALPAPAQATAATSPAAAPAAPAAATPQPAEPSEADQLKASIAAAPEAERPADPNSVTTTTSQAHANTLLRNAIDAVFAQGLDDRMMAAMPDFWKLYYQSVAAKTDYKPSDPSVLRQNQVDQKARLLTSFEPDSNDFAQAAGVAGMSLYHTVIGVDGKPGEIAVARPIGFGLDENAVAAIRKAKFSPAIKNGQPVPVMLDLVVQFRIFSHLTNTTAKAGPATPSEPNNQGPEKQGPEKPAPVLPGPYSIQHP